MKDGFILLVALVVVALAFFLWQPDKVIGEQGVYGEETGIRVPTVPVGSRVLSETEEAALSETPALSSPVSTVVPAPFDELTAEEKGRVLSGLFDEMAAGLEVSNASVMGELGRG